MTVTPRNSAVESRSESRSSPNSFEVGTLHERLLDAVEQAVIVTDLTGRVIFWNRVAEKLYQWSSDEAVGRNVMELLSRASMMDEADKIMDSVRGGEIWNGDFVVQRKDGSVLPISVTNSPLYDDERLVVGIVGISHDISERKRSEQALIESESKYRFLLEQASDGIHTYNSEGRFLEVNSRLCEMLGYSRDELLSLRVQDLVPSEDLASNPIRFDRLLAGELLLKERRLRRKDGTLISTEISGKMIEPGVFHASVRDVSERTKMQSVLDAQKEALEMVVGDFPLSSVLQYLAGVVEKLGGGACVASIMLLDDERRLRNGASPSLPETYLNAIDGLEADPNVGTCCAAAATGRPVITADIEADDKWQGLSELPLGLGLRAAWTMPILARDGHVLGTFGTYFRERRKPSPFESQVVAMLASTAALAIERKALDERLSQEEARLRSIFEASHDGILVEKDDTIVYVNSAYLHQFGYQDSKELLGHDISMIIAPEESDRLRNYGRRRSSGLPAPSRYEFKGKCKDGTFIDVEASVSKSTAGKTTYITTIIRDITERKLAQEALQKSENQLRLVTDAIPLLVSFVDSELKYRFVNRAYSAWFEIPRDEVIGLHVSEVLGTDAYDALLPEIEKVLSGETVTFEREVPYRTGERYIHVNYIPQLGTRGEVIGFHSFVWDISAMKAAEKALRRSGLEMEERVVERTRELELANRERINILHQLVSAQEDERGRMARDVHDQLGQQMTVLRLKLERLENISNGRPDRLREIHDIREFARQLDADVDFLAWRFRPAVLDDIGIVAALDQYVTRWSNHSHVAAKFTSRPLRKDRMDGDTATNYYRIVQEALNNISKHANASVVDVILVPRESGTVLIIEDNGIGFDPDEQRRDGGGMGLLGMSERAALIGGKLEIESAKGRGTTIFVTVPGPARIENGNE